METGGIVADGTTGEQVRQDVAKEQDAARIDADGDLAAARALLAETSNVIARADEVIARNARLLEQLREEWPEEPTVSDRADDLRCFAGDRP